MFGINEFHSSKMCPKDRGREKERKNVRKSLWKDETLCLCSDDAEDYLFTRCFLHFENGPLFFFLLHKIFSCICLKMQQNGDCITNYRFKLSVNFIDFSGFSWKNFFIRCTKYIQKLKRLLT